MGMLQRLAAKQESARKAEKATQERYEQGLASAKELRAARNRTEDAINAAAIERGRKGNR